METYLPAACDFLCWNKVEKGVLKGRVLNPPLCIELNITGKKEYNGFYEKDLDIFTIERILKEIKNLKVPWLVMGYKRDIFSHKSINSFFRILRELNLNIYSLQTDCLYLGRIDLENLLLSIKNKIFVKKKNNMKNYEKEIFRENLLKILEKKLNYNLEKPFVFLLEDDFEEKEKEELEKKGAKFLEEFLFCLPELIPFLPFFFLSIESNGFCFSGENNLKNVSSIFFNSIKKIWFSKKIRVMRKNILGGFKEEILIKTY